MKLVQCPGCNAPLIKKTIPEHLNRFKYENCGARCAVDYFQYYKHSYDEQDVDYIVFNTPNGKFMVYTYFNHIKYKNEVHVYSCDTLTKHGKADILLTIPLEKCSLEILGLEELQNKIDTLSLFV